MRNSKQAIKRLAIALGALLLISAVGLAQVAVQIPTVTAKMGTTQSIPINVGDLTLKGVISFQFTVAYNPAYVSITGVTTAGTLAAGLNAPVVNTGTPGQVTVAAAGTSSLAGSGTLIYLNATMVGKGTTNLTFSNFEFNEGNPAATLTNGMVIVPVLSVKVADSTISAPIGGSFKLPISTEDVTGQQALSYQFTVSFDPTKVNLTGVDIAGTLSSAFSAPVVNTSTAGKLKVAAAGSAALTGSGILIKLVGTVVAAGGSTISFDAFQYNEGTPAAGGVSGSVTVGVNTKPTFTAKMKDTTVAQGQALSYTFKATDIETPTGLSFKLESGPTGATLTTAGVFLWTPTFSQLGPYPVVVSVTDGQLGDTAKFTITVAKTFRKPVMNSRTPTSVSTVSKGVATTFSVDATDLDGGALSYVWKLNDAVVLGPGPRNSYVYTSNDPHGTARKLSVVFTTGAGLSDSTVWNFTITGIADVPQLPTDFYLGQNYPNPFNPTTQISYSLPKEATVTFEIYNMLGVKIRTLMAGVSKSAGQYTITWDGKDNSGVSMPSGIYLYRIEAGSFVSSKKMTLLK